MTRKKELYILIRKIVLISGLLIFVLVHFLRERYFLSQFKSIKELNYVEGNIMEFTCYHDIAYLKLNKVNVFIVGASNHALQKKYSFCDFIKKDDKIEVMPNSKFVTVYRDSMKYNFGIDDPLYSENPRRLEASSKLEHH